MTFLSSLCEKAGATLMHQTVKPAANDYHKSILASFKRKKLASLIAGMSHDLTGLYPVSETIVWQFPLPPFEAYLLCNC